MFSQVFLNLSPIYSSLSRLAFLLDDLHIASYSVHVFLRIIYIYAGRASKIDASKSEVLHGLVLIPGARPPICNRRDAPGKCGAMSPGIFLLIVSLGLLCGR
jgi:hypothetical protein